jgi:hypothetical protein
LILPADPAENNLMIIPGRVHNGVVVLEGSTALPEGAEVTVSYPAPAPTKPPGEKKRINVPLVQTGQPGGVNLTGEQIHEILDAEDVEAVKRKWNVSS